MTNAQETNVKQEPLSEQAFLDTLINLCDDLAWGRPASEDRLFALTKEGAGPKNYVRLAEAFGMMLVKVESREYHRSQLIADLKTRNAELEEAHRLLAERNTHLMRTIQENYQTKKIVGQCEAMRKVIQLALTIARRPINTLILGPTGAGKEVIAKAIHFNSPRREGPFVAVNCTAIPDSLFESEMFGYVGGAFTGANPQGKAGFFEAADGGTIFLDEIGEIPLQIQAKLLSVIQNKVVCRVGSTRSVPVDVRILAATNRDLRAEVAAGRFRQDLYYRLSAFSVELPPLRSCPEDVCFLIDRLMEKIPQKYGVPPRSLSGEAFGKLLAYNWPGNIRELENVLENAVALSESELIYAEHIHLEGTAPAPLTLKERLKREERQILRQTLAQCGGSRVKAMELLGLSKTVFYGKLKEYQLD